MKAPRKTSISPTGIPSTSRQIPKQLNQELKLNQFTENAEKTLSEIKTEFKNFISSTNEYTAKINQKLTKSPKTFRSVSVQFLSTEVEKKDVSDNVSNKSEKSNNRDVGCQCDDDSNCEEIHYEEKFTQINETFEIIKDNQCTQYETETCRRDIATNTCNNIINNQLNRRDSKDVSNLVQQSLPRVDIPASLVIQHTLNLEIKPTLQEIRIAKQNTCYKEFKHENTLTSEELADNNENNITFNTIIVTCSKDDKKQEDEEDATCAKQCQEKGNECLNQKKNLSEIEDITNNKEIRTTISKNSVKDIYCEDSSLIQTGKEVAKPYESTYNFKSEETAKISPGKRNESSEMQVLEIVEDGRSLNEIVNKSILALRQYSAESTDFTKNMEKEEIMEIIKDGKDDKIHNLREYGEVNKGKRSMLDNTNYNFQELDEMLKGKIDQMRESLTSEEVRQRELESERRKAAIAAKGSIVEFKTPERRVSISSASNGETLTLSENVNNTDNNVDSLKEVRKVVDIKENSEDSFVLGTDIGIQCCLSKYTDDQSLQMDLSLNCHKEYSSLVLNDVNSDQISKIAQVSKGIQTSSSASLALMFNEKLIEKIKSIPRDIEKLRLDDDNNKVSDNYDKNIDSYKMTINKEMMCHKKKRRNQKLGENVLQPMKFNCHDENTNREYRRRHHHRHQSGNDTFDNVKLLECKNVKPKAISLDTSLATTLDSYSEGEIKCHCSTSIGEVHTCKKKYNESIKSNVQYLKNHPDEFMQYEHADNKVKVLRKRIVNDNWHTYYLTSTSSSP